MRAGSRRLTMASQRNASAGVAVGPLVPGIAQPVHHQGVHVLVVTGGIVAHGVAHHRRMAPRHAHVERRVARVAVGLVGVRRLPVVGAEVRLRQRHQHPRVIRRAQDLREAQVRARLAAVVVGVNEIDPETLEAQQALLGRLVGRQRGAHLGVVQRHQRQDTSRVPFR